MLSISIASSIWNRNSSAARTPIITAIIMTISMEIMLMIMLMLMLMRTPTPTAG